MTWPNIWWHYTIIGSGQQNKEFLMIISSWFHYLKPVVLKKISILYMNLSTSQLITEFSQMVIFNLSLNPAISCNPLSSVIRWLLQQKISMCSRNCYWMFKWMVLGMVMKMVDFPWICWLIYEEMLNVIKFSYMNMMAQHMTAVTLLLMPWHYYSLVLSHGNKFLLDSQSVPMSLPD